MAFMLQTFISVQTRSGRSVFGLGSSTAPDPTRFLEQMDPRPTETDRANQNSKPDPTDRAKIGFGSGLGRVGFLGLGSGLNRDRTSLVLCVRHSGTTYSKVDRPCS